MERGLRGSVRMTSRLMARRPGSVALRAAESTASSAREAASLRTFLEAGELLAAMRTLESQLRQHSQRATGKSSFQATMAELAVLRCLADAARPLTLGSVAARLQRDASSVSVLVQRLHKRRLVQRRSDSGDRRRLLLAATPMGRRVVEATPDRARVALAHAIDGWSPEQVGAAVDLFTKLTTGLASAP